jgi:hypothetical protein
MAILPREFRRVERREGLEELERREQQLGATVYVGFREDGSVETELGRRSG